MIQSADPTLKPGVKYAVVLTYLGMIGVNAAANILPINGITTGAVSDAYPNLFAPAGITFAIWGVIYLLLAGYSAYQLGFFGGAGVREKSQLLRSVGMLFSVSSIANIFWIFAWHYRQILISLILMLIILVCLLLINLQTRKEKLSLLQSFLIRLPFSVYFGWITVATIANVTTLLVDMKWNGLGISETIWTVAILIIGIVIGIVTTYRNRDIAYGLVFVWAYSGIVTKHIRPENFNFKYPSVVFTAMGSIILILVTILFVLINQIKAERNKLKNL